MNTPSKIVRFTPIGESAEAKDNETLLDVARRVVAGADHLTAPTAIESQVAERRKLDPDERLACQAVVCGDCEVTTSYW